MFYTYVLQSEHNGNWYVGYTKDLQDRVNRHQSDRVPATKHRGPWQLIYYEACLNKNDAIDREKYYKTGFGKATLRRRLSHYLQDSQLEARDGGLGRR